MIEYLNNPALLILACEIMAFLLVVNLVLVYLLSKKNNKAVKALNALVTEIKEKGESNKKKMAEMLLQPGLTDPEAIKKGMQELVSGQTQLYKDMIKAIRTQDLEDVSRLGESVSDLVGRAINLGRESGEGMVDKEAQARLETENENLHKANDQLENKLQRTADEMESLMSEYKSMMNNVNSDGEQEPEPEQEIMDITEGSEDEDIIDIAGGDDAEADADSDDAEQTEAADESNDGEEENGSINDIEDDILEDMAAEMADEMSEATDNNEEEAA